MSHPPAIFIAFFLLVGLFLVFPWYLFRRGKTELTLLPPGSYSLILFSCIAFIPMFVLVEMSGRYGIATLMAVMVFGLLDMLSPIILRPIQWITRRHNISGLVEILVFRFRGRGFGQFVTLILLVCCLPLAIALFQAASETGLIFLGIDNSNALRWLVPLLIATLVLGYLWFGLDARNRSLSLAMPLCIAGAFVLLTMITAMLVIVYDVFGNFQAMNNQVVSQQLFQKTIRIEYVPALVAAFLCASIVMPQLYRVRSYLPNEKTVNLTAWLFPLLLLLGSLPMLPLLWSGIELKAEIPLQMYGPSLAILINKPWLAVLTACGALMAVTAGLAMLTSTLAQPIVNNLVMPKNPSFITAPLRQWLSRNYRLTSMALLVSFLFFFSFSVTRSITDLILVSFAGLAQFAPAVLAAFYFQSINRTGVICGLIAGLLLWFTGLLLPLFFGPWQLTLPLLEYGMQMGTANWSSLFYEALFLNITVSTVVSIFTRKDQLQSFFARECQVDTIPQPVRLELGQRDIEDFHQGLNQLFDPDTSEQLINKLLNRLNLSRSESRPQLLRLFRFQLARELNSLIGTNGSFTIMNRVAPVVSYRPVHNNFVAFETILDAASPQLSGVSAELNKLRIYHRDTLQNLPVGLCAIDECGEIVTWNQALESFTGILQSQCMGALIEQLPNPWDRVFCDFLEGGQTTEIAINVRINGMDHWYSLHRTSMRSGNDVSNSEVILVEDVTDAVVMNRGLVHADRLASVGRLAAGVAHEIGNPVTGITCLAQDILAAEEEDDVPDYARMILQQAQRITDIVRSLTSFSRSGDRTFILFPLADSLKEAVTLLDLDNRKEINFQQQVDPALQINGDPHQITQVFLNLLQNAYDASDENGSVTISAERVAQTIVLRVMDNGKGIPESIRDLVFEPFFTTKDIGQGTGLGLSLVNDIITFHKGSITIEDCKSGNCMRIELPAAFTSESTAVHNSPS